MSAESPPWLKLLHSRTGKVGPAARATRAELWIVLAIVLVACTIPIGRAIFDGSRTFCAIDTATSQEPWWKGASGVDRGPRPGGPVTSADRAADPLLVEAGCRLYPTWRYTSEEIATGRLPAWNPSIGVGAPWLADPRAGVFDPQVLALGALEVMGGHASFDRGFAWMAWLRLAAAAFGAYVLARRLGLSVVAAALGSAGFGGSAACLVSVNLPEGHVAAVVPWLFIALDRLRDRTSLRGLALVALATMFLALGGDVETAFFAGSAALVWTACVLHDRARWFGFAGLALGILGSAPLLLPFLEALERSQALVERQALVAAGHFDFVALGLLVVTAGLVVAWRALEPEDKSGKRGLAGTVGVVFASCACAFVLSGRGLGAAGRALVLYDAHGSLGTTWRGTGAFSDSVVAWVSAVVVALALASFFAFAGPLHARKVVQVVALSALLLAIGTPGLVDVWHLVPFFGLGAPMKAAAVAALFVSLLAGEALDAAPRVARRTAGLVFVALVSLALVERPVAPKLVPDRSERFLAWTEAPPPVWTKGQASVAGHVTDELPCAGLMLRAQRVAEDGRALEGPREDGAAFAVWMELEPAPQGRRTFRSKPLEATDFAPGTWRFSIDVQQEFADGDFGSIGSRDIAFSKIAPEPRISAASMAYTMLSFLVLLFAAGAPSRWRWLAVLLAVLQPVWMSRGLLPSADRDPGFVLSATERFVQGTIGANRLVTDPNVFPGETGLLQRMPIVNARTALESAAFARWWSKSLKPDVDPALRPSAATVDPFSTAFRLLGVSMLANSWRVGPPGFGLVADPDEMTAVRAEAFLYRARDPLPRAFCVTHVLDRRDVASHDPLRDPSFDPEHEAFLEGGETWRPASPATTTRVELGQRSSDRVRLSAEADGDALLVLTDAAFPGWIARVDGIEQKVLTVDGLFRGVPITRGTHTVEFEYAPTSWRIGAWIGGLSLAAILALAMLVRRPRIDPAAQPAG